MISPAIHLPGTCKEAIEFYEYVFGATGTQIEYYRDAPAGSGMTVTEDTRELVMHATITISGTPVNMSDTLDTVSAGNLICLNVFLNSADEVCRAYERLKEGGEVMVELGPQFFSAMYGSVKDQYGVAWQLIS